MAKKPQHNIDTVPALWRRLCFVLCGRETLVSQLVNFPPHFYTNL